MNTRIRNSGELRERAGRLIENLTETGPSELAAIQSLSEKLYRVPEALRRWVWQSQR